MEKTDFNDYILANIMDNDVSKLTEFEKTLSKEKNTDIVLIAYQPNENAKD